MAAKAPRARRAQMNIRNMNSTRRLTQRELSLSDKDGHFDDVFLFLPFAKRNPQDIFSLVRDRRIRGQHSARINLWGQGKELLERRRSPTDRRKARCAPS